MKRALLGLLVISAGCSRGQAPPPRAPSAETLPVSEPAPACPLQDAPVPPALDTTGSDNLELERVSYSDLPGWRRDKHGEALTAFVASCETLAEKEDTDAVGTSPFGGSVSHWRAACADARTMVGQGHKRARTFFEKHFHPYAARGSAGSEGRITGYYVQPLRASRKRGGRYQFPLYRRPDDLVSVRLDDFVEDGRARRVWGRIHEPSGKLVPFPTRSEFAHEISGKEDEAVLLWLDSPADVVLVEIEGSGSATLDDGTVVQVAFAGKNGRRSETRGAARALRKLERKRSGTKWTRKELARARELLAEKSSIVFFEIEERDGAIGSQNVVLTPRRSLAVDRALVPLSTPVWVETRAPTSADAEHEPWRHLLIAQDTGGAIVGSVRGDIYWGADEEAVSIGRRVNGAGRMWLLLPKGIPSMDREPS